jgi:hypothetical protein
LGLERRWTVGEEAVLAVDTFQRWKKTDEWVPLISGREKRVPLRVCAGWAVGLFLVRARTVSRGLLSIFFLSLLFF